MAQDSYDLKLKNEDIDGIIGESEKSIDKILSTKNTKDLIQLEEDLSKDINYLDSAMKTMVYENYNKLLQTSEIMECMNKQFETINEKISNLTFSLNDCFQQSLALWSELRPCQEKFMKCYNERSLYTILEKIHNLPSTMTKLLDDDDFESLLNLYSKTMPLLEKHDNHSAIAKIKDSVSLIVENSRSSLIKKLQNDSLPKETLLKYVDHLIFLNHPPNLVQSLLLQFMSKHLNQLSSSRNFKNIGACDWKNFRDTSSYINRVFSYKAVLGCKIELNDCFQLFHSSFNCFLHELTSLITVSIINKDNFDQILEEFKQIYLDAVEIDSLFNSQFFNEIHQVGNHFKATLIEKIQNCLFDHSLVVLASFKDRFLTSFKHLEIDEDKSKSFLSLAHECSSEITTHVESYVFIFLSVNFIEPQLDRFQQLFDDYFIFLGVKELLLLKFFENIVRFLKTQSTFPLKEDNDVYWLLQLYLIVMDITDNRIPLLMRQFHSTFHQNNSNHKFKSNCYQLLLTSYVNFRTCLFIEFFEKYTSIFIVNPIYALFLYQSIENTFHSDNNTLFGDLLETIQFCFTIIRLTTDSCTIIPKNSNHINFQVIKQALGKSTEDFMSFTQSIDAERLNENGIIDFNPRKMFALIYESILKTFIEIARFRIFTEQEVHKLQVELYRFKHHFYFQNNGEKCASYLERKLASSINSSSPQSLLSIEDLKPKIE